MSLRLPPSSQLPINKPSTRANSLNSHFRPKRGCHYIAELLLKSFLLIFQPLYNIEGEGTVTWGEEMWKRYREISNWGVATTLLKHLRQKNCVCACYRGKRWINTETESKTDRKEMYMDTHLHMFRFIKTKLYPTLSLHGSSSLLRREMRARQMKGVVLTRARRGPALGDCSSPSADTLRSCHTPLI